ncbi:hypothetical protein BON22_1630 [Cyberlindnera fabianii]|uniref:Uncharacterized protein n=1 Tax=Cyberlindnera fabianii TaxID=36022 RepID=A0A1V2LAX3_CYBFA|nr:hypothetical protein BON22_1630 [Cyberlindnera fabianii]
MAPPVKREDLIVPYIHVKKVADDNASANFVSQSMPMAAMFMRNKLLSWFTIFSAVIAVLYEVHGQTTVDGQSGLLRLLTALVGVGVCYMELLLPGTMMGPQSKIKKAAEQLSETVSAVSASATK